MSVFLAFHHPCLDGTYAVLMSYLYYREAQKLGISAKDFIAYIAQFNDYKSIDKPITKDMEHHSKISQSQEESKIDFKSHSSNEYSQASIKDVVYIPAHNNASGIFSFPYNTYAPSFLKESVLILMDYAGGSAKSVSSICQKFLKVIIIDHHLSFEHMVTELHNTKTYPKNLMYLYNVEKSGASLALEFFEKVKGGPLLPDFEKYSKLRQIVKYVEDNDMKAGKVKDSSDFASGIFNKKAVLNPLDNPKLFHDLMELDINTTIKIGAIENEKRKNEAKKIIMNKHLVFLGGQIAQQVGKNGTCYGVFINDPDLTNEICSLLAKESAKDGMENIGFVYSLTKNKDKFRVSLRSARDLPGGNCEELARNHQGGGHYSAAGFYLEFSEFQQWIAPVTWAYLVGGSGNYYYHPYSYNYYYPYPYYSSSHYRAYL
jgi:nanoRNase/pAp phosphatase (c-di-AMP/oligoRNAs hydrolase)